MTSRSSRNPEGARGSLRPDRLCGCSGLPGSGAGTTSSLAHVPGWPCKPAPADEPGVPADGGDQRELVARLRAVIEAKDTENAMLRAELQDQRERYRQLKLRAAELERRLGSDSTTSGTPPSKDPIGARQRRKAERKARQSSERERRKDRKPGGQPGHPGAGLSRDPHPDKQEDVPPPAECSRCGTGLEDAWRAGKLSIGPKLQTEILPRGTDPLAMLAGDSAHAHLFLAIRPAHRLALVCRRGPVDDSAQRGRPSLVRGSFRSAGEDDRQGRTALRGARGRCPGQRRESGVSS